MTLDRIRRIAGVGFMLLALFIVGSCDKQDQDAEVTEYCHNVKAGIWPDYQKIYKYECGEDPPPFYPN